MRMMRSTFAVLMSLVLFSAPATGLAAERGQGEAGLELLRQGIELVEDGEFDTAVEILESAAAELDESGRGAPRDMAMTYFYAGVAHVFLSGDDEAMVAFRQARRQDPAFNPAPAEFPGRIMRLWESAGGTVDAAAGGSGALSSARPGAALQDESGGGGGWWRWAALAGGGAAAAGYFALNRNQPPVAALSVSPSGSGMAGLTSYRFDGGRSSDPDSDSLTYSWSFGDGASGSGVNASHVYDSPGTYSVTLTVSDGKEEATSTGTVDVARNLDGGQFVSDTLSVSRGQTILLRFQETISLRQTGSSLAGSSTSSGDLGGSSPVSGTLSSARNFVCPCDITLSGAGVRFQGTVDNGANILEGDLTIGIQGLGTLTWRDVPLRRR